MLGMVPEFFGNGLKRGYRKTHEEENPEAAEKQKHVGIPIMGRILSAVGGRKPESRREGQKSMDLIVHSSPESSFSEYYRSIRTTVLLSETDAKMRVLAVMSPLPQEGKTATISNLACALAQAGKKVVLIDADLRKPRLHKIFRVKNLNGLTKYLTSNLALKDLLRITPIPTLFLINAGPMPPNPIDLLEFEKMADLIDRLKEIFDFILVDTPPMLGVSDAIVLGPQLDGAILVVRAGKTPREALRQAREKLDAHKIKGMGVIINHAQMRDFDYSYTDSYYEYYRRTQA